MDGRECVLHVGLLEHKDARLTRPDSIMQMPAACLHSVYRDVGCL